MKRFLLSFIVTSCCLIIKAQTPCVQSYTGNNLGGGNCVTVKMGNAKVYPGYGSELQNNNYFPTGKITVYFKSAIPAGTTAPEILQAGPDNGSGGIIAGQVFDYKYRPFDDNVSVPRVSVVYCYYGSASNQNIFNGNKAPKLTFIIKYQTSSGNQACTGVIEEIPLPVHFKSFNADRKDASTVTLKWTTASEQNNRGFYIQRNIGGEWKNIAFVFSQADGGNSSSDLSYEYFDANMEKGITQYRIQQVDLDSKASYSDIRAIRGEGAANKVSVYPNPSLDGKVNLVFENGNAVRDVQINDMQGRIIKLYKEVRGNVLIVEKLSSGFYTLKITDHNTAVSSVEKVVVK